MFHRSCHLAANMGYATAITWQEKSCRRIAAERVFVYATAMIASSLLFHSAFNSFIPGTFFLQSFLDTPAYSSSIPLMIFIISARTSLG